MKKETKTQEKILDLAIELIQSRGVNGFSFAMIAEEIGIKKASIHYYFPSKMDLVFKALVRYCQQFERALLSIEEKEEPLFQRLLDFTGLYRKEVEEKKINLCLLLATEHLSLTDTINQAVVDFFNRNLQWLEQGGLSASQAKDFYATLQGIQFLSRVRHDLDDFDQIMVDKIISSSKKRSV